MLFVEKWNAALREGYNKYEWDQKELHTDRKHMYVGESYTQATVSVDDLIVTVVLSGCFLILLESR